MQESLSGHQHYAVLGGCEAVVLQESQAAFFQVIIHQNLGVVDGLETALEECHME